jgi:uncharacterized protein (TIGR00730 family)
MQRVCVYCGSYSGRDPLYGAQAVALGQELARRGMTLVYGGGRVGLMGTVADAALRAGGKVIGVMPKALVDKELAHQGLTELHVVNSMHERKTMMADLSDGFVTMPGGFGTMDEFCEIMTWLQLGFHRKPVSILNVNGYFDGLLAFFNHTVEQGFVKASHRDAIIVDQQPASLLDAMLTWQPAFEAKWITADEQR